MPTLVNSEHGSLRRSLPRCAGTQAASPYHLNAVSNLLVRHLTDDPCVEVVCAKRECVERPTESVPCNAFDASDQGSDSNTADAESDSADGSNSDTPVDTDVTTTDTGQTTDTDTTLRSDADVANSETNDSEFPLSSETDGTGTEQQGDGFDVGPADAYPSDLAAEETFDPEVDVSERECDANSDCSRLEGPCSVGFCQANGKCLQTSRSGSCDDNVPCTYSDTCVGDTCVGTLHECDDGKDCTNDLCDGSGGCLTQLRPDTCLIEGACYSLADANPSNPCKHCDGGGEWALTSGLSCDDRDACTTEDRCIAGTCEAGPLVSDLGFDWIVTLWGRSFAPGRAFSMTHSTQT